MSEINSFADVVLNAKNAKTIKSFDESKHFLSNEILLQYQFDLPKEFNFYDILALPNQHRFMKNFSKTLSFNQSFDYLKKELTNYFKYNPSSPEKKSERILNKDKYVSTSFKQVFFNVDSDIGSKLIVDDITDFNLQKASVDSLKTVIDDFQESSEGPVEVSNVEAKNYELISSDSNFEKSDQIEAEQSNSLLEETELTNLMKNFNIELVRTKPKSIIDNKEHSKDKLLSETFELLGIGSIKKNLGKSIITKKKNEGLFFDEWVKENLNWTQFLIKKLAHIDYLSLKDESYYLAIVRNYVFSDKFTNELSKLYKSLGIDQNN